MGRRRARAPGTQAKADRTRAPAGEAQRQWALAEAPRAGEDLDGIVVGDEGARVLAGEDHRAYSRVGVGAAYKLVELGNHRRSHEVVGWVVQARQRDPPALLDPHRLLHCDPYQRCRWITCSTAMRRFERKRPRGQPTGMIG